MSKAITVELTEDQKQSLLEGMESKTKTITTEFVDLFEQVFDKDWEYSKQMMGIGPETEEQKRNAKALGLESVETISDNGTFIRPKVEDETEDWGHRGALLAKYRELKELL